MASEQEVLGLIRQRETPLGHRSQRSVGTSPARRLACGALMESGSGGRGAGTSALTFDSESQWQRDGALLKNPHPRRPSQHRLAARRAACSAVSDGISVPAQRFAVKIHSDVSQNGFRNSIWFEATCSFTACQRADLNTFKIYKTVLITEKVCFFSV